MPHYGASTTPYPDPILIVRFTSPQNEPIPSITVWVKIAGSSTPFDAMLTCDRNSPAYHFETFRAGAERGLKLDSMILPVTVTFVIGEEYQTIPFELRVGVTH